MIAHSQTSFDDNVKLIEGLLSLGVPMIPIDSLIQEVLSIPYNDDSFIFKLLALQTKLGERRENAFEPFENIVGKRYSVYSKKNVEKIDGYLEPNENAIMVTMTTCKRLDLFKETVNSFLECCSDLSEYLLKWIVVDDNSSESDRREMMSLYPFIEFIWKKPEEKGHARSMNIIREKILNFGIKYVWHLEDDFRFFRKGRWISKCVAVLEDNPRLGQCLLNRCYGEDVSVGSLIGGGHRRYLRNIQLLKSPEILRYYIHEYAVGDALFKIHKKLSDQGLNSCAYWPHYSLRVGLTRASVYESVGKFNENAEHFEMDYAHRYRKLWLTAYLDQVICTHIGRRTYERESGKTNAYDLNQEKQFGEKLKNLEPEIRIDSISLKTRSQVGADSTSSAPTVVAQQMALKVYVLNLARRPDRLKKFREMNQGELTHFHRFEAIDGKLLKPSLFIQQLFEPNDYHYRRGIVGCALSHLLMWSELAGSNLSGMIIIEDDAELTRNFIPKVVNLIETTPRADIIFFHHHPYSAFYSPEYLDEIREPIAEEWNLEKSKRQNMGGTTAYWITKQGAMNMIKYIEKTGIKFGIDWVMFHNTLNKVYYSSPFLAYAECAQSEGLDKSDTDIQNDFTCVRFENGNEWMHEELAYWKESLRDAFPELKQFEKPDGRILCRAGKCDHEELLSNMILFRRDESTIEWLRLFPVHYLFVNQYILSVPDPMLNSEKLQERNWFNYLNIPALNEWHQKYSK